MHQFCMKLEQLKYKISQKKPFMSISRTYATVTYCKKDKKVWGCSIITSRIGGGWVSALFVMLRDGKQWGEWYLKKSRDVTVKKIIKPFFALL